MPGGAGRAAAQGPWGPSVQTPAAGHGVGPCCPLPQHRTPTLGAGRSRAAGYLTGWRSASGAPQRPGRPSLPAEVARGPGRGRRGASRTHLKQPEYAGPAGRRSPERSGGRVVSEGLASTPPRTAGRGAAPRRKDASRAAQSERPGRHCLRPAPPPPRRTPQPEPRGRPRLCPRPPRTPALSLRDRRRGRRHPPPRRRGARPAESFPTRASPSGETGAGTSGRKWALRSGDRPSRPAAAPRARPEAAQGSEGGPSLPHPRGTGGQIEGPTARGGPVTHRLAGRCLRSHSPAARYPGGRAAASRRRRPQR